VSAVFISVPEVTRVLPGVILADDRRPMLESAGRVHKIGGGRYACGATAFEALRRGPFSAGGAFAGSGLAVAASVGACSAGVTAAGDALPGVGWEAGISGTPPVFGLMWPVLPRSFDSRASTDVLAKPRGRRLSRVPLLNRNR
jgi:hypothetical protein